MKVISAIFTTLLFINSSAQLPLPYDTSTGRISYTEIVKVDSVNKRELFERVLEWVALNYKSANNVIQLKDETTGKVILKGVFTELGVYNVVPVFHTIIINVKDYKCKIQITDLNYDYTYSGYREAGNLEDWLIKKVQKKKNEDFVMACDKRIKEALFGFSVFMQKPLKIDNW